MNQSNANPKSGPPIRSVAVVVDPGFGEKLRDLSKRIHVWVCGSETNQSVAQEILSETDPETADLESGLTGFKFELKDTAENVFLDIIATVDEHHNHHSHSPAWSKLEVYGVALTDVIRETLSNDYGCDQFSEDDSGFIAERKNWNSLH